MSYWLLKSEPEHDYGYDDLERDGATTWNGVSNNLALKHMRAVRRGDQALLYHTGKEKSAVGIVEITTDAYPDPAAGNERIVAFDIKALRRLRKPVALAEVKADPAFTDFLLVRMSRLSVMPVSAAHWKRLLKLGGG
jgi:predicted RNA-binding protein with PUA-like domain